MKHVNGRLYGIGVGPGDPELIPLKSVRILKDVADVVFAASSSGSEHSYALEIARPHLGEDIQIVMLSFPMTADAEEEKGAWKENAKIVTDYLRRGKSAAFITIGDPLTYSTYGYLAGEVKRLLPDAIIKTIPGITSYQAAAAMANVVLTEGDEPLLVLSGLMERDRLKGLIEKADNIILLKAYRNMGEICSLIGQMGLTDRTMGFVRCGLEGEEVVADLKEMSDKKPDYLSLLMIKKIKGAL
jgi:precorrin-2/cobalt-factor-2 C20-methyltransferase